MKKIILIALLLTAVLTFGLFRIFFLFDDKPKENTAEAGETIQGLKEEEKTEEEKTEEEKPKEEPQENISNIETEAAADDFSDDEKVYKMLDFDRRLILSIGQQDRETCSIYCLAYARAIIDNSFSVNPYDYWDDGAVWRAAEFGDIAGSDPLDIVLKRAYEQIDDGRPVIIYTSGTYATTLNDQVQERSASEHFVMLFGYRYNADYNDLKPSDFYGADPSYAYSQTQENYVPWVILTDSAPELMNGEYALFAPIDQNIHIKTCLAHPDSIRWDGDIKDPVYPDYVQ